MILSTIISNLLTFLTQSEKIILFIILLIPCSEIIIQINQFILSKTVNSKLIPKMDYQKGIPKEQSTMVVIPTIVKSKEKIIELTRKLEVYYIANKSENLYFTLLGDCSESSKEEEVYDKEVIEEGKKQIERLNKKYSKDIVCPDGCVIFRLIAKKTGNENFFKGKFLDWY